MRIEDGRIINDFIDKNKCQYCIPVYQRNYEWTAEQCKKLFEDIISAHKRDHKHFCGSIVYSLLKEENKIDYYVIIDGQQRLTTIFLLIKALIDTTDSEEHKELLNRCLFNEDKFKKYNIDDSSKLKLKPIKSDNNQLLLLVEDKIDAMEKSSGIYRNYTLFCNLIKEFYLDNPEMDATNIYDGLEHLICATIKLEDKDDNAQEIFERINSTGVPLNLADKIRNFVLMTDINQDELYEDYWLPMETSLSREQLSSFFLDYLNMKLEGFAKESTAYESFKDLYNSKNYTNEAMLKELKHYADLYYVFINGSSKYSASVNKSLAGLKQVNQTTVYLFLFHVFDDYLSGVIDETELSRILKFLLSYSIRRIVCEVSSNSLRGLYKTLYGRVFNKEENKQNYYDAIVSFMQQLTSRDVVPNDYEFTQALKKNNLYSKHALCKYLLLEIENQGKEKISSDMLSVEHIMPQNKNMSTAWQNMLGDNWIDDKDRLLHTLGNLTLTGYNSELGDKPFEEKKDMIEENPTKMVILYQDVKNTDVWNAYTIEKRAERLASEVRKIYAIDQPKVEISFADSRYKEYTAENPDDATYKYVNYYELCGERVICDSFALMVRSVAAKLYALDSSVIENMAKSKERIFNWSYPLFSYDVNDVRGETKLAKDNDIYIYTGYSARTCISIIRELLNRYNLDIDNDFRYSARTNK